MAAAADGKVIINTQLNNKGFNKGVKGLKNELGGLQGVVGKLGKMLAGAFAVGALVKFGKECIDLGSDVQEVQNVVDTAFGDMAYKAEEFAATAITQFGMSTLAAKKTASNYMAMAKGMGVVPEAASDMSIALAGLSGDVASFYNLDQEEAAQKLAGVFTGEGEALKSIGVVMTETNLQAYALSQGITKQMKDMTQAEKVALRYGFVTNSLSLAQGDFAKTSNGWANQTRILSMQWQEFMSILGQALITVLRPMVKVLNQLVGYLITMANALNSFMTSIFGEAESQTEKTADAASKALGAATEGQEDLTAATKETAKAQKNTVAGFDEINKLSSSGSGSGSDGKEESAADGGSLGIAIPALKIEDPEVVGDKNAFAETVGKWVASIDWKKIKESLDGFWSAISRSGDIAKDGVLWVFSEFLVPLGTWTMNSVVPAFLDILSGSLTILNNVAVALRPLGVWLWENFLKPMASWTGGVIVSVLESIGLALTVVGDWIAENQPLVETIAIVIGSFAAAWVLVNAAIQIWNVIGAIASAVTTAFGAAVAFLTSPIGLVVLAIGALIAIIVLCVKHWDTIKEAAGKCWDWIKGIWEGVANWFNNTIVQPIANFFGGLWTGIKGAAGALAEWIKAKVIDPIINIFKKLYNSVAGIVEGMINGFIGVINGFIKGINLAIDAINLIPGVEIPNLKTIPKVSIPRLAQGAVIPPNKEFMAVLGDQKSGTNIETPLATMVQAFKQALAESGGGGAQTIVLQIDGREFGRAVKKYGGREDQRIGVSLVGVRG